MNLDCNIITKLKKWLILYNLKNKRKSICTLNTTKRHPSIFTLNPIRQPHLVNHLRGAHRYARDLLVTGGADFTVNIWSMQEVYQLLYTFTVHGGEITQLITPPSDCNVCSFYSLSVFIYPTVHSLILSFI